MDSRLPSGEGRARIDGPAIPPGPNAALSLSLALHDLGTNATNQGSWSVPEGRIDIVCTVEGDGSVGLDRTARDGPEVHPPKRSGFGSGLFHGGLAREPDGRVAVDCPPRGMICRIEFNPWRDSDAEEPDPAGR